MHSVQALVLVTVFVLVGCSEKVRKNQSGVGPVTTLQHKASACPQITGDYQKDSTNRKSFRIVPISNGIQFTDSETEYIIDGNTHVPKGNSELTYKGSCENNSIVIDVFEEAVYLGRFKYSISGENQLSIETTALDSRLGEDGTEIWLSQPESN